MQACVCRYACDVQAALCKQSMHSIAPSHSNHSAQQQRQPTGPCKACDGLRDDDAPAATLVHAGALITGRCTPHPHLSTTTPALTLFLRSKHAWSGCLGGSSRVLCFFWITTKVMGGL
jgi:hypothetical protein